MSRSPSVAKSSRPTLTTRGILEGSHWKTVGRPCGSCAVVMVPAGLWKRHKRVSSAWEMVLPSTVMRFADVTLSAGDVIFLPSTVTRPASIILSASRRDAIPARARRLAIRSDMAAISVMEHDHSPLVLDFKVIVVCESGMASRARGSCGYQLLFIFHLRRVRARHTHHIPL